MTLSTRLILVRHAETESTMKGHCYGSLDVDLSPVGIEHAQWIAEHLRGVGVDAIYSSPRARSSETAWPLAESLAKELVIDERLREIDFGDFEGRSYERIEVEFPELFATWMKSPTEVTFPHGECFADVQTRALGAIESILNRHSGEVVAVVTHGGVLRALLVGTLMMSREAAFRLDLSYGSVTIIDWLDATPVVRVLNATAQGVATRGGGFDVAYSRDEGVRTST